MEEASGGVVDEEGAADGAGAVEEESEAASVADEFESVLGFRPDERGGGRSGEGVVGGADGEEVEEAVAGAGGAGADLEAPVAEEGGTAGRLGALELSGEEVGVHLPIASGGPEFASGAADEAEFGIEGEERLAEEASVARSVCPASVGWFWVWRSHSLRKSGCEAATRS